jgi:hypothetical protein
MPHGLHWLKQYLDRDQMLDHIGQGHFSCSLSYCYPVPDPMLDAELMVGDESWTRDTRLSQAGNSNKLVRTILHRLYLKLVIGLGPDPCQRDKP